MGFVVALYIILLVVFLVTSGLILRHTMKFGYLSPRFKTIVMIFGLLALIVIVFSLYLVFNLFSGSSSDPPYSYPTTSTSEINF